MLEIHQITLKDEHWPLLLDADPERQMVEKYLPGGLLFEGRLPGFPKPAALAVALPLSSSTVELKNLAVHPCLQRKGYGREMLLFLFDHFCQSYEEMLVGTSHNVIPFYEKNGFRFSHRLDNFFSDNYNGLIGEDGKPLDHMYYLKKSLKVVQKMTKYAITAQNLPSFAYTNEELLSASPSAIALDFHGLNMNQMLLEHSDKARLYAEHNVLLIMPYDNPWSWMNSIAMEETDAILDAAIARLSLPANIPIVSTGGSMGGLSALSFTVRSRHSICACAANCPVCDLPFHYTERPDLPRTILSAFWYCENVEQAILEASPLNRIQDFPNIPYYIVHGQADKAVNLQRHSLPLVEGMRARNLNVTFVSVPNMEHCAMNEETAKAYHDFVFSFANRC